MKLATITVIIACVLTCAIGVKIGIEWPREPATVPYYVNNYIDREVEVEKIIEVEKIVERIVTETVKVPSYITIESTIEKIVEVKVPLKEFESVEQLREWITSIEIKLPCVMYPAPSGETDFNRQWSDPRYDCDDYATDFQKLAAADGWIVSQCATLNGNVYWVPVTSVSGVHIGNMAKIKGVYYYIETSPSANRWRIVKICDAD
jgi:hypothetical protein